MAGRIKNILVICGINLLILAALFCLIEITVRFMCPDLIICGIRGDYLQQNKYGGSYGLKPNVHGRIFEKKVITDDYGFRIEDIEKPVSDPDFKILFLGDSISFGLGIDARYAFPYILRNNIKSCRVINTSVPGYGIDDYFNVMTAVSDEIKYDGIIVTICLDDYVSIAQKTIKNYFDDLNGREKLIRNGFTRFIVKFNNSFFDFNSFLREHSKAYMLVRDRIIDTSRVVFEAQDSIYSAPDIRDRVLSSMKKIHDFAYRHNKWLIFVVVPMEYQMRNHASTQYLRPQDIINTVSAKASFEVIDMYPYFKESSRSGTSLFIDSMHLSKTGHKIVADAVYRRLTRMRFLDHPVHR